MISESDLNPGALILTPFQRVNFRRLFVVANEVERSYRADGGGFLKVNRGVSSVAEQRRINPEHPDDAHVKAAGVDFDDPYGKLYDWCLAHLDFLEKSGLYLESRASAPRHVHLQTYPPKSGRRIFIA